MTISSDYSHVPSTRICVGPTAPCCVSMLLGYPVTPGFTTWRPKDIGFVGSKLYISIYIYICTNIIHIICIYIL